MTVSLADHFDEHEDNERYSFVRSEIRATSPWDDAVEVLAELMAKNKSDPDVTSDLLNTLGWSAAVAAGPVSMAAGHLFGQQPALPSCWPMGRWILRFEGCSIPSNPTDFERHPAANGTGQRGREALLGIAGCIHPPRPAAVKAVRLWVWAAIRPVGPDVITVGRGSRMQGQPVSHRRPRLGLPTWHPGPLLPLDAPPPACGRASPTAKPAGQPRRGPQGWNSYPLVGVACPGGRGSFFAGGA